MTVAYVIGASPQPESTFTHDEIEALSKLLELRRAATIATRTDANWIAPGGHLSGRLLKAAAWAGVRHPVALSRALASISVAAWRKPRDLAVGLRAALAACVLADGMHPDVIHAQFAGPAAATAFVWSRLTGIPYSVRAHAYDIYAPYAWLPTVLRGSAAVLAISEHARRYVAGMFGVEAALLRVGIPINTIRRRPPRPAGVPFRILSVGALTEKKGHANAIEAIGELSSRGARVSLDIIGDGPLRAQLSAHAGSLPIAFRGSMPGTEVRSAYADYDLFLMTSQRAPNGDMDGIPVVLMEAMAAGLPVVSTVVGGMAELVSDRQTGTTTEGEPSAVAAAIDTVMRSYEQHLAMTDAARRRIETDYDLETQTHRLAHVLLTLAGHSASRVGSKAGATSPGAQD